MLFSASERKGLWVILFLITCIIMVPRHFLARDHHLFLIPASIEVPGDSVILSGADSPTAPVHRYKKAVPHPVELNSADSVALVKIRGIGPYYASRILRYRQRLGGFHSVKQLKELKMTYFNVDSCAHLFTVNADLIHRADMDTMSFKSILRHPYLEYEDVQMIFNAKRKYGHLSYALLEEHGVLPAYKLKKIKPYFK